MANKIKLKKIMERADVIAYLEDFLTGLKRGKILLQEGEQTITLLPPDVAAVEVEVKEKLGKEKFSLEIEWRRES